MNYNGLRWLGGLYESIFSDDYNDKKIYLVDNASTDNSQIFTKQNYPEIELIQHSQNLGYCEAYNRATLKAFSEGCDFVVWLNNDTKIVPGWLDEFAYAAQSDPRIGVIGPFFLEWEADGPSEFMRTRYPKLCRHHGAELSNVLDCDWVEGSCLALSRNCFFDTGYLDSRLFMYWEEADYCRRARRKGWRVVIATKSYVRHFRGGTAGLDETSKLKVRNEFVYEFCNPERALLRNVTATFFLLIVKLRSSLASRGTVRKNMFAIIQGFVAFLQEIRIWLKKYDQDRNDIKL